MTYAQGGTIEASDYNNFLGAAAGTQGGGTQINPVWATGLASYGYGQTALSNVSVGGTVQATEWAGLINNINNASRHQSGSSAGLTAPVAGDIITYITMLSSSISTVASNRLAVATTGASTNLNKTITLTASGGVAVSGNQVWTATFSSVDQARYFFNAGGNFKLEFVSATNTDGSQRSASVISLAQTGFTSKTLYATSWSSRTGTTGIATVDTTSGGFYGLTGSYATYLNINSSNYYYTSDYITLEAYSSGGAGSYGGNGNVINFRITLYSGTTGSTQPTDTINCSVTLKVTANYPPTTYLSNSWGTVSIT